MFVRQAARQIELFTGLVPDTEAMRQIMRKALSPLTKAFEEEEGGDVPYPPKEDKQDEADKDEEGE